MDAVGVAAVDEVAEPVEPVAEEALMLPWEDDEDDELVTVSFNAYIDNRAEPPQYSFALAAQITVHPLVWSLPDMPEPDSTFIVFPQ
jgi:hypothetical protein